MSPRPQRILATLAFLVTIALAGGAQAQTQFFALPTAGACDASPNGICFKVTSVIDSATSEAITGIAGGNSSATGVHGTAIRGYGVWGTVSYPNVVFGAGVYGEAVQDGIGVKAKSYSGKGLFAESTTNDAAEFKTPAPGRSAIYAHNDATSGTTWAGFYQTSSPSGHSLHGVNNVGGYAVYSDGPAGGTSAWANLSDRRAKKGIVVISGDEGARIVEAIEPVTYEWRDEKRPGRFTGFIAQNMAEAIPGSTRVDKASGMMMTDYTAAVPPLVAYVKAIEKRLAAAEAKLAAKRR